MKFTEEYVMCMEKYVFDKNAYIWAIKVFIKTNLSWKDSPWCGNILTLR